ncbi:hypothetical protein J450_09040 [Mannheimia haemolytica D171]|nr:hypothetical protein J450_09040 [Mannheimia haemolytica D171]
MPAQAKSVMKPIVALVSVLVQNMQFQAMLN